FGRPALLPSAHVALALRTGAALLPAFAWREKGFLVARIEEPLDLVSTGDRDADVRAGVRQFAARLERYVKEHPEQWSVFEPVWRLHGYSGPAASQRPGRRSLINRGDSRVGRAHRARCDRAHL